MHTCVQFSLAIVAVAAMSSNVLAVPELINFQGVLLDAGGNPVTVTSSVNFRIWSAETGGLTVWQETQSITPDANGRFTVLLGSNVPLSHSDFSVSDRYLGVRIVPDPELVPRYRLVTAPYAFRPATVDGASGGYIQGTLKCGGSQTATGGDNFLAGSANSAAGYAASVTAGIFNEADGLYSIIGGGISNEASGSTSFVGGGNTNSAEGLSCVVGGGYSNRAGSTFQGTDYGTVPGGFRNGALGEASFAAGHAALAGSDYSCVFNFDTALGGLDSTFSFGQGTFTVRAAGGYSLLSASHVVSNTAGVSLASGSSSWSTISDRNAKDDFEPVNGDELLEKLAAMEIPTWRYKAQDESIRHIGPMAQDFYAAFGLGEDNKHITTVDADGVALAAIKVLHKRTERIDELEHRIAELTLLVEQLVSQR